MEIHEHTVEKSLGEISVPEQTFEYDLKINEGYQAYGSELLRLALGAIVGLSIVWLKTYAPGSVGAISVPYPMFLRLSFISSYSLLVTSSASSLIYKYTAADSLAYHLTALRRRLRGKPRLGSSKSDEERAGEQETRRRILFKRCERLLSLSIATLVVGLLVFGVGMASLMR